MASKGNFSNPSCIITPIHIVMNFENPCPVLRSGFITVLKCLSGLLAAVGMMAPTSADEATPAGILARLQSSDHPRNMSIPFREIRHFQLKKTDMVFTGIMRLHPGYGISIEYTEPTQRIIILTPLGLKIRQPDENVDRMAPDEANTIAGVFLDLLQLDTERLNEQFTVEIRFWKDPEWTLELMPKTGELRRYFTVIDLEGSDDTLESIYLQNGHSRWKRIEFLRVPQEWNPTEQELKTYF